MDLLKNSGQGETVFRVISLLCLMIVLTGLLSFLHKCKITLLYSVTKGSKFATDHKLLNTVPQKVATSDVAGFAIFSVLGFMTYEQGVDISEVAESGK